MTVDSIEKPDKVTKYSSKANATISNLVWTDKKDSENCKNIKCLSRSLLVSLLFVYAMKNEVILLKNLHQSIKRGMSHVRSLRAQITFSN